MIGLNGGFDATTLPLCKCETVEYIFGSPPLVLERRYCPGGHAARDAGDRGARLDRWRVRPVGDVINAETLLSERMISGEGAV